MEPQFTTHPSVLAAVGLVVAVASLLLNIFIVPGGIYLMRAFIREEIKLHDGTEHAHPNLKSQDALGVKLDNLSRTVHEAFENLGAQMASLRLQLSEDMSKQSQERRDDIDKAIREHEERENENNKRIVEEARMMSSVNRRKS